MILQKNDTYLFFPSAPLIFFLEATGPSVAITNHLGDVEPAGCQILEPLGAKKAMARQDRPQDAWGPFSTPQGAKSTGRPRLTTEIIQYPNSKAHPLQKLSP